jgi:hypothetical protein
MDFNVTLAMALSAAGAVVVAGFITGIVEIIMRIAPIAHGHGQGIALVLAALVVIAAIADQVSKGEMVLDIAVIFGAVLAWYGIARVAMGIHDDVLNRDASTSLGKAV